jgi:hypothetical protein
MSQLIGSLIEAICACVVFFLIFGIIVGVLAVGISIVYVALAMFSKFNHYMIMEISLAIGGVLFIVLLCWFLAYNQVRTWQQDKYTSFKSIPGDLWKEFLRNIGKG